MKALVNGYYPFGMLMPGRQIYLDTTSRNVGNTTTTAAPIDTTVIELYRHGFSDTPSTHPYVTAPDVLNTGLNTSIWTNSNSAWTSMASNTSMGKAITMMSSIGDTATVMLAVNINSGKKVSIKSFSFYQRSNITGYMHWKMYINGIEIGDSTLYAPTSGGTGSSTMESIGTRLVGNTIDNLTGNITVLFKLYDHDAGSPGGSSQGQFRLDDFVLNGYVNDEGAGSATGTQYAQNGSYRYGFNGKENDDEVKGEANQQDYGMRIYDPRLGRFLSVDPITDEYPELTPYQFASNSPIALLDIDGLEGGWELKSPAANLRSQYELQSNAPTKKTPNSATSSPKPVIIPPATSETSPITTQLKARAGAMQKKPAIPPTAVNNQPAASISQGHTETPYEKNLRENREQDKALQGAVMDPLASSVIYQGGTAAAKTVNSTVNSAYEHVEGIKWGAKANNYEKVFWNTVGLGLDIVPFFIGPFEKIPVSGGNIPSRLTRIIPEEFAGSPMLGAAGSIDVFVTVPGELKGLTTSEQIAQKLTLRDQNGNFIKGPFRIIEFDTPTQGLAQPYNRQNPGFINGGKTAGGAIEYVLPNQNISDLKNVTQTVIK